MLPTFHPLICPLALTCAGGWKPGSVPPGMYGARQLPPQYLDLLAAIGVPFGEVDTTHTAVGVSAHLRIILRWPGYDIDASCVHREGAAQQLVATEAVA
jgi:hypothetical protein